MAEIYDIKEFKTRKLQESRTNYTEDDILAEICKTKSCLKDNL